MRHIRFLKEHYGIEHFHFKDDNLTLKPSRTRDLLEAISPFQITWDTPNGVRADTITPDVARLMLQAGARSVTIAVESGDQYILNEVVHKQFDLAIGFPGESRPQADRTLRFGAKSEIRPKSIVSAR